MPLPWARMVCMYVCMPLRIPWARMVCMYVCMPLPWARMVCMCVCMPLPWARMVCMYVACPFLGLGLPAPGPHQPPCPVHMLHTHAHTKAPVTYPCPYSYPALPVPAACLPQLCGCHNWCSNEPDCFCFWRAFLMRAALSSSTLWNGPPGLLQPSKITVLPPNLQPLMTTVYDCSKQYL